MQVLEASGSESVLISLDKGEFAILVMYPGNESTRLTRHRMIETVNQISRHLKQYLNISVSMGISFPGIGWTQWGEQYRGAAQLACLRFYYGLDYTGFPEDNPYKVRLTTVEAPCGTGELLYRLDMGTSDWREAADRWLQSIQSLGIIQVEIILRQYKSFLMELGVLIHAKGLTWPDILDTVQSPYEHLEQLEWMPQIHDWLYEILKKTCEAIQTGRNASENIPRLIDKAKKMIERHHAAPISLSLVSQQVGVSESYLSKVFVKETGENFSDYVARIRIENAIQMLNSGIKIYEVGERVGYPNQTHFSRIFKKVTGKMPIEYKNRK